MPGIKHPTDEMLMWGGLAYGGTALALIILYMILASFTGRETSLKRWLSPRGSVKWRQILARNCFCNLYVREADFVAQCGMDAYMSLRGIRFQAVAMFLVSLFVSGGLLPLYYAQEQPEKCIDICSGVKRNESSKNGEFYHQFDSASILVGRQSDAFHSDCVCSGADKLSMASIAPGSPLLWCPVAGVAVATLILMLLLRREYREIVRVRAAYWLAQPPEMFTVLCDDIPTHLDLHTTEGLRRHFAGIFPDQILRIDPVRFNDESLLKQMRDVAKRRMACYDRITRLMALRDRYGRVPRCHAVCLNMCCGSGSGDVSYSISRLEEKYEALNRDFEELFYAYKKVEEDEAAGKLARPIRACFITFSSATAATISAQAVLDHRYSVVAVHASEPDDIIWDSLGYGATQRACSKYAARLGFFLLVIFWGAFAASVGALTSLDVIKREIPQLRKFLEANSAVESIVEQLAPLLLSSLLAIVNPVVCFLARVEARASEADADQLATTWYFVFLVVQVFIFYGVSGPIFNSIDVSRPSEIVSTLASRIPQNASFYILFFATKFVTFLCMDMYRVIDVLLDFLRRCLLGAALSHRDRRNVRCGCHVLSFPAHRNLSSLNGQMLLLFFIAISYAVIQPLIAPVACVFFYVAYFVYARMFLAVNMQRFDAGGTLWTRTYYCYVSAILVAQLTLIGLLSLRRGYEQSSAVLVLFLLTAFVAAMIDFRYRPLVTALPLDLAARIDQKIDDDEPASMLAASVWQYGMLTGEDPNYLGRRIKANIRFNAPLGPGAGGSGVTPSGGSHHHGGHHNSSSNLDDTFDTGDDDDDDDGMDDPILASYRNNSADRLQQQQLGQDGLQGRQHASPPSARIAVSGRSGAFEFFSYELPVLREPPILDLPESATQDVGRDSRQANYDVSSNTAPLLREP
ncbi:CSC1-like protein At4g02900 [Hondaea fermentalgiana]|uniref:CSC1-like protein At4g02900 n=1 Tax=Hondaea fermentalgiana TaxID=2315210 RepID=A0A2R5GBR9_9STRA|nr:CSC1-like protein At4g02900 [Hondaea fermentalgiana]|eukprot:GBG28427.1 CSC1-like protein At4g02900 [Hondaea fermentalgiana]